MLIKVTADVEEPDCMKCDYCCASDIPCKHCGPEYGWANYQRWVEDNTNRDYDRNERLQFK